NKKENFEAKELRRAFRLAPRTQSHYLAELKRYGLLENSGGNRYRGYKYSLTKYDDYEQISTDMNSIFDQVLEKLSRQVSKE
ncbi:MAG: hypothetical protein MK212_19835, partial [Saprospiraceae bacterium]|nr:hypothetical protein [Saprospiraceae bacterium]